MCVCMCVCVNCVSEACACACVCHTIYVCVWGVGSILDSTKPSTEYLDLPDCLRLPCSRTIHSTSHHLSSPL